MRAVALMLLRSLCLLTAVSASLLPCDTVVGGDTCVINKPQTALPGGTYTCCADYSNFRLEAPLQCVSGSSCSFIIAVNGTVTINGPGAMLAVGGYLNPIQITAGVIALNNKANLTGPVIQLISNLNSSSTGVACAASYLIASGAGEVGPGYGTPTVPGATLSYYGVGRALGASHAGAGATGYDSTPESLYETSLTYPSNPFALPEVGDVLMLTGSRGGSTNASSGVGMNLPGAGGGLVQLTAPNSAIQLNKCVLAADGGTGMDAGGGSGGSVIVDGASISATNTAASANGGATYGTSDAVNCADMPCGLPGGGGYVFARSSGGSITPLLQWGSAAGGSTSTFAKALPGLCGGAGLLVDCQGNAGADTDCDVGIVQSSACSKASDVAVACKDSNAKQPQTSTTCLLPPTELSCGSLECGALTLASGANLTIGVGGIVSNRSITASASSFSSVAPSPVLSARLNVVLDNVFFSTPSDDTPQNYTVNSTAGSLTWTASNMALFGSLSVSAGKGLTATFTNVNISASPSFLNSSSCSNVAWQGALTLAGGVQCNTTNACFSGDPNGRVTFSGSVRATTFGAYAFTDVSIGGGAGVVATGCLSSAGPGAGSPVTIVGPDGPPAQIGVTAGGGAGHHSKGGRQLNSGTQSGVGGEGAIYDANPFAVYPPVPVGGSGGGGDNVTGGLGGGTIVLTGSGTLLANAGASATLSAAGGAGQSSSSSVGGGGSGGSVVLAFSGFNYANPAEADVMAALTLSAAGGSGGAQVFGTTVCGGGGSGGNVIVAVPLPASSALPRPPSVLNKGGRNTLPCEAGGDGNPVTYYNLPFPPSNTMTSSATATSTSSPCSSSSASATATATSSASYSTLSAPSGSLSVPPMPSSSASFTSSASASATASASVTATATATATATPSVTATPSITASVTPSSTPAPQILGLKVPYFIAATTAGGALFLAVFVWILVKTACAPAVKGAMMVPSSPAGSLWSSTNASAGDRAGLLSNAADDSWSGGAAYVPPSGVV